MPADPKKHDPSPASADPSATDAVMRIDESDRYASLRLIPWWKQERLRQSTVLVVGAGALGNEALKNLALVGVGRILVVDLDAIETSNLSRSVFFRESDAGRPKSQVAAERARELNPEIEIHPIHGDVTLDLGLGLFDDADVVIGCLDNREARLWVNRMCWRVGTPWVDAGIQEIQGVVKVFVPPHSACYECAMTARDYELLNRRYSCPLLRRDEILEGKVPTAPTIASMMAALEVQEALKILHDLNVVGGVAHVYNGVGNQFYTTRLPFREDCLSHESYDHVQPVDLSAEDTATALFEHARCSLSGKLSIALDRELVTAIEWPQSARRVDVLQPRARVGSRQSLDEFGNAGVPILHSTIAEDEHLASYRMAALGIPPYDIVRVDGDEASVYLKLSRDRERFFGEKTRA
jgi:adenylyltransferase/sulfurtransferase